MRTPQSEWTLVAQQVFPKKTWSRKPPPKCTCLLTFQEGTPSASRGLHDPTSPVGPSVPGQEGREVRMRRPSPPEARRLSTLRLWKRLRLPLFPLLCSRLRGTRPQSPDPSGRPGGYPGARRLGPAASGRSLVSAASLPRAGPASSSSTERPVAR